MAGRGRPTWTPERSARLVSMLDIGLSVARAAEILGATDNSCYLHLSRIGHAPPTGRRKPQARPSTADYHNFKWRGAYAGAPDLCPQHLARLIKHQHAWSRPHGTR